MDSNIISSVDSLSESATNFSWSLFVLVLICGGILYAGSIFMPEWKSKAVGVFIAVVVAAIIVSNAQAIIDFLESL